jgi:hypothetical protein
MEAAMKENLNLLMIAAAALLALGVGYLAKTRRVKKLPKQRELPFKPAAPVEKSEEHESYAEAAR